ncbi:hypothetical protein [Sinomonas halotolerans]|uniref:Uncharacterized protein n=1 Tax=Sinomonas halotolerans TaxID=1644133 RepID=A0ABU9X0M5_9MICC
MIERGSDKHGPHLDDQMKHESEGDIQGGRPAHAEEWKDKEPFPDETDDIETRAAVDRDLGAEGTGAQQPSAPAEDRGQRQDPGQGKDQ